MNFVTDHKEIIMRFTIAVYQTDEGLFMIDYGTSRVTMGDYLSFEWTPTIIGITNFALFIILLTNIKAQRQEQELLIKQKRRDEKKRLKKEKLENMSEQEEAKIQHKSESSSHSSDEQEETTLKAQCVYWILYILKFKYLWGATYLNILELFSCTLVLIQ